MTGCFYIGENIYNKPTGFPGGTPTAYANTALISFSCQDITANTKRMKPDGTCDCTLQASGTQVDVLKTIDPHAPLIKKPLQISTTPHLKCINNKFTSYLLVHPLIAQSEVILQCACKFAGKF